MTTTAAHHRAGRFPSVPPYSATNAALLIDFDNVTLGVRSDLTKELRHLLDSDIIKGKVSVQRAYADWRRYPQYIVPLSESSIDLIFAPAFGTNKKNATDIRLAIDATELVFTRPEIGTFILLSGDSDFSSLVIKLKEYGKYVIGVGIRESASDILIQNCDEYYSYTELAGLTKESDTPSTQRDPWELVVEAVDKMVANRDVMRADRLKQVMQQIDPNFDESNAGFNRFSKFVQEAGSRGLIGLAKMDNGQYEVSAVARPASETGRSGSAAASGSTGGGSRRGRGRGGRRDEASTSAAAPAATAASSAAAAPAATESAAATTAEPEKERSRRRRRGGRGRSRSEERPVESEAPETAARQLALREQLTLAEALHLLTRALGELPAPVAHDTLRARMAALHGREDPLLEVERFPRLLRQANDAEAADVRQIDETHYEVSPHRADLALQRRAPAEPAASESTPATATVTATKGVRFRAGSGSGRRSGQVPLVGVVRLEEPAVTAPASAPEPAEEQAAPAAASSGGTSARKKSARKKTATKRTGATAARSETAATTASGAKKTTSTRKRTARKTVTAASTTKKAAARKTTAKAAAPRKSASKSTTKAASKSATKTATRRRRSTTKAASGKDAS